MPAFDMILHDEASVPPRRLELTAAHPEQAFQIAQSQNLGVAVELWRADMLIARMTKAADNLWLLHGARGAQAHSCSPADAPMARA